MHSNSTTNCAIRLRSRQRGSSPTGTLRSNLLKILQSFDFFNLSIGSSGPSPVEHEYLKTASGRKSQQNVLVTLRSLVSWPQKGKGCPGIAHLPHPFIIHCIVRLLTIPLPSQRPIRRIIESLQSHSVNTLTELVRVERIAATCDESDAVAFQGPMTEAWSYYVSSNQFLTELRGLTRNYPFCGDIVTDAQMRVRSDPESNRSWNMAWLCLQKTVNE